MSQSENGTPDLSSHLIRLQNIIEETPSVMNVETKKLQDIQESSTPEDSPSDAKQVEINMNDMTDAYERFKARTRFIDTTETPENCGVGCMKSGNHNHKHHSENPKPMNRQQRRAKEREEKKARKIIAKKIQNAATKKLRRGTPINVSNKLSHRSAQMSTGPDIPLYQGASFSEPIPGVHLNAFEADELLPLESIIDIYDSDELPPLIETTD